VTRERGEIVLDYGAFVALRNVLAQNLGERTKEQFRPLAIRDMPRPDEAKRDREK